LNQHSLSPPSPLPIVLLEAQPSSAAPSAADPSARPPPQTEACVNFLELRLDGELPACCLNTNPEAPVPNVRMDRAEWEAFNEEFDYPQRFGSLPRPATQHRPPASPAGSGPRLHPHCAPREAPRARGQDVRDRQEVRACGLGRVCRGKLPVPGPCLLFRGRHHRAGRRTPRPGPAPARAPPRAAVGTR